MNFASIRIITDDVDRLVRFYEPITGVAAERPVPVFAEFVMPSCTLAIAHSGTARLFGEDSVQAARNRTVIIEFLIEDVEAEYARLQPFVDT